MSDQDENQNQDAGFLTKRDFMVACQALAETHNKYLEAYKTDENLNEYSKDEMEHAIQNTHATFVKFQAILASTIPIEPTDEADVEDDTLPMETKTK